MCNLSKGVEEKSISTGVEEHNYMYKLSKELEEDAIAKALEAWNEGEYRLYPKEKFIAKFVKGYAIGFEETILSSTRNLMDSAGLSAEQAMALLQIPEAEQEEYLPLLKQ